MNKIACVVALLGAGVASLSQSEPIDAPVVWPVPAASPSPDLAFQCVDCPVESDGAATLIESPVANIAQPTVKYVATASYGSAGGYGSSHSSHSMHSSSSSYGSADGYGLGRGRLINAWRARRAHRVASRSYGSAGR